MSRSHLKKQKNILLWLLTVAILFGALLPTMGVAADTGPSTADASESTSTVTNGALGGEDLPPDDAGLGSPGESTSEPSGEGDTSFDGPARLPSARDFGGGIVLFGVINEDDVKLKLFTLKYLMNGDWHDFTNEPLIVDPDLIQGLDFVYDFYIDNSVPISAGDTYSFQLPPIIKVPSVQTDVPLAAGLAKYSVDLSGNVTVTFNEGFASLDNRDFSVASTMSMDVSVFDADRVHEIKVPYGESQVFETTIIAHKDDLNGADTKSGNSYTIKDGVKTPTDFKATHADWVVRVNDDMMPHAAGAKVVDALTGNHKLDTSSIEVFRIVRKLNGVYIDEEKLNSGYTLSAETDGGYTLTFDDAILDTYEIRYTTLLGQEGPGSNTKVSNTAAITLGGETKNVADEIELKWGEDIPSVVKSGVVQAGSNDQLIDWTIKYNYTEASLGDVSLVDTLSYGEIAESTLKIYEVMFDANGIEVLGAPVNDYELTTNPSDAKEKTITIPNSNGKAYRITFSSTVPSGLNKDVINNVEHTEDPTLSDDAKVPVNTIPSFGKVREQSVDDNGDPYVLWTVTINENKVPTSSFSLYDFFNDTHLNLDSSSFVLKRDGVDVSIPEGTLTLNLDHPDPVDSRKGFKLDITNPGSSTFVLSYITYYTVDGLNQPNIANEAEVYLVYPGGDGPGTGHVEYPAVTIAGPKPGLEKEGEYVYDETNQRQIIGWTVLFNQSKIALEKPTLKDEFDKTKLTLIDGSVKIYKKLDDTNKVELTPVTDYTFSDETYGFLITFANDTEPLEYELYYETTAADKDNEAADNKTTLSWQGIEEPAETSVPERHPGVSKGVETETQADGTKVNKWTVKFNENKHVIYDVTLVDKYTPKTAKPENIVLVCLDGANGGAGTTLTEGTAYTLTYDDTIGQFTIEMLTPLEPYEYVLTYQTPHGIADEQDGATNDVTLTYRGGEGLGSAQVPAVVLAVDKKGKIDKTVKPRQIDWEITANATNKAGDHEMGYVYLVDAVLTDTIPADQEYVDGSIKVYRSDAPTVKCDISTWGFNYNSTTRTWSLNLPNGPYQYIVKFKTDIVQYPALPHLKQTSYQMDRYFNDTELTNQSNNVALKKTADDTASIRYFEGGGSNRPSKSGAQDPDDDRIKWSATVNANALPIKNAYIMDTLDQYQDFVQDTVKLYVYGLVPEPMLLTKDTHYTIEFGTVTIEGKTVATFKIHLKAHTDLPGEIDNGLHFKYEVHYHTVLKSDIIGQRTVSNKIAAVGHLDNEDIESNSNSTFAAKWYFGGGASGTTLTLNVVKVGEDGVVMPGMKFYLVRVTGTNTEELTPYTTNESGYLIAENLRAGRYILREHPTTIYEPLGDIYFRLEYNDDGSAKVSLTKSDFITAKTYDYVKTDHLIGEGEDAKSYTQITNTRKKAQIEVTKSWINGPTPRPDVYLQLWRSWQEDEGGNTVDKKEKVEEIKALLSGTFTYDYGQLLSYHDSGSLYTYYVKEVNAAGEDFVPENYQKDETGLVVTNTYVIPKTPDPIVARKIWNDQDNKDGVTRPGVSFELWRKNGTAGAGEKVVNATAVPATLTVNFGNQDKTDINGVDYEYYIEEVFENSSAVTNQNWDVEVNGLTATNSIKTASGSLTITKALLDNSGLNGEEQTSSGGTPAAGATPLVFTFAVTGPYGYNETVTLSAGESATLADLYFGEYKVTETMAHGYVPSYTPLNGNVTVSASNAEVQVTVENKHATTSDPNVVRVNSTKVWNGGPSKDHTAIQLVLQRKSAGNDFEVVTGATSTVTQTATTPLAMFSYSWENLPKHDVLGYEYTYRVIEADVVDGQVTINGNTYNVTITPSSGTTTITNTYQIPQTAAFTATKVWASDNPTKVTRPGVAFELWQIHSGTGVEVRVAGPEVVPSSGEVNFAAQNATDFAGVPYRYEVREVFTDPGDIKNNNWISTVDGMEVTNSVIAPLGKLMIKKDLLDASGLPGGTGAIGTGTGEKLTFNFTVSGPYGFNQTFELSPGDTLSLSNLYYGTYTVTETDSLGFVASYHNAQSVNLREAVPEITVTVKNDFKRGADDPNLVNVHATKTWINGAASDHEAPTMILSRTSGGPSEVVPAVPTINPATGMSMFFTYDWEGLPKYDPVGLLYTYSVTEANVVDDIYMVGDHAYAVTRDGNHFANTYIVPTEGALEAHKVWVDGPSERPAIWFQLWRSYISEGVEISEPVPDAERKPISSTILAASWSNLDETTLAAEVYTFFVKEGYFDGTGFVEGAHPDYTAEVTADGEGIYELTNTYIPRVSVGNYVWFDVNKDGLQDATDRPIEGAILELTTPDGDPVLDIYGNPVTTTVTDEHGYYEFTNLPVTDAGYKVTVTPPGDYIPTLAEVGSDSSLDSSTDWATSTALPNDGDEDMTLDFGFVRPEVTVGDYVWFDVNKDGLQDATDRPLEGVTLTITHKDGSPVFDVDGNPVTTTVTDKHGYYEFTRLPITSEGYKVTIAAPEGYIPTLAGAGDDRSLDSSTGEAMSTPLETDGAKDMTLDFGFVKPEVKVGDYVWFDVNKDGLQDATDRPIPGVTLTISHLDGSPVYNVNGDLVGPTVTDENGYYEFAQLPVTEEGYKVTITPPEGYIPTLAGVGDDRALDSSTGSATSTSLLVDGAKDMTLDFGFVKPEVKVGDYVWFDVNKDGLQDATDRPIPGVTLTLTHADGSPVYNVNGDLVGPTVTDKNGYYEFAQLPVTEEGYKVTIAPPEGYIPTLAGVGDDRAHDSSTGSATSTSLLVDGAKDMTLDFGFVKPEVKVGNYVWFDVNKDGLQDDKDRPLEGVTLTITHLDGSPVYNVNGDLVGPTVTDKNGYYEFAQLPVTTEGYKVTITSPAGYVPTRAGVGSDRGIDSSTGYVTSTALPNDGDEDMTLDFGFILKPAAPDVPKTGEDSSPLPHIGLGLAIAATVLFLFNRRRQKVV